MCLHACRKTSESPKKKVITNLPPLFFKALSLSSAKRIDELESRLSRMEAMLLESRSSKNHGQNSAAHSSYSNPTHWENSQPQNLTTFTSSISAMSGGTVDSSFIPTTSMLPTEVISYLQQNIEPPLASDRKSTIAGSGKRVHKRGYTRLPSKDEVLALLVDFFEGYNNMFPLFQPKMFMRSFEQDYTRDRPEDSAWWAILNIVVALSIRLNPDRKELNDKACEYAQNAFNVIPDLTMKQPDLITIQALLGMAIFLQGTPNPRPSSVLIAAAIRLSHSLGMHRREFCKGLLPIEAEQRQRVFWVAYCLDKDFSLRFEQPPIINDNDMDVDLPEEEPQDGLGLMNIAGGASTVNYFRLRIHLAVIQSKAYTDLYSVRAQKLSEGEKLDAVQRLDHLLEDWKNGLPVGLRPNNLVTSVSPLSVVHILVLHLLYFNCLTTVHRVSFQNSFWRKAIMRENRGLGTVQSQLCHSASRCVEAARASMHLMKLAPQGDYACTWYVKYEQLHLLCVNTHFNRTLLSYCVSAIVIVLAKILHVPTHNFAHSDMDLVRPQIQLLNSLAEIQSTEEIERMREFCNELAGRAQIALYRNHPPTEAEEPAARWSRTHETTQLLPVYQSQADTYTNQNNNPDTNSAVLVCQSRSIRYLSAKKKI